MEIAKLEPARASRRSQSGWKFTLCIVALAAAAVVTPFLFLGNASGHDFQFHLASWMDVAGQWREGVLFPRWAEWSNWGFGEPRFVFYPPASWLIGAATGSLLPWKAAAGAYAWLALCIAGMSMWKLARVWLPGPQVALAAVLFAANPYSLAIVYYRSDFAELLGVALFPLLVWGSLEIAREKLRAIPFLAMVFAAIWLCNAPEGVLATYSLSLVLVVSSVRRRSIKPLIHGAASMLAGFALAAFYMLPALWEQRWVQISQAFSANLRVERNFIFTRAGDPDFLLFNWKISLVALGMMLSSAIAATFVAWRRRQFQLAGSVFLALGIATSFLMVRPSAPLWRLLPKLALLQFPWRWLGPLGVVFAFFLAEAIGALRPGWARNLAVVLAIVAIGITGFSIARGTWWDDEDVPFLLGEIHSGHGYEGTDEYAPIGSDRYQLPGATPDAQEIPAIPPTPEISEFDAATGKIRAASAVRIKVEQWTGELKTFSESSEKPVTLALRLVTYPAWEVQVDSKDVRPESADMTDEMLVPLPAGNHRVNARFRRTWDRAAGDAISLLSAIALLGYMWNSRRGRKA